MAGSGTSTSDLAALEARAAGLETSPGWIARPEPIFWPEPRSQFVPAHWSYAPIRAALADAARLVDLSLAERRILALRNPHPGNNFATTRTLSLSYQLMLPGETAGTHRHASHALRVMLDAKGTYSVVDGIEMPMETGDIVLTPGGCWHGHAHRGSEPACWVDGLDIPLTHLLEPMFFEPYPGRFQQATSRTDASPLRFAAADIKARLDTAPVPALGDAGRRIELPAPDMPAMGLVVLRLAKGEATRLRRSTASRSWVVMEGEGRSQIGGSSFEWRRGDTLAAPAWTWLRHTATSQAQLFELSDAPLMKACKYWREETGE